MSSNNTGRDPVQSDGSNAKDEGDLPLRRDREGISGPVGPASEPLLGAGAGVNNLVPQDQDTPEGRLPRRTIIESPDGDDGDPTTIRGR